MMHSFAAQVINGPIENVSDQIRSPPFATTVQENINRYRKIQTFACMLQLRVSVGVRKGTYRTGLRIIFGPASFVVVVVVLNFLSKACYLFLWFNDYSRAALRRIRVETRRARAF